ncbi:MAG: 4'-phosphopantetheinyl transferase superfamily protein [Desulfobacteraceae bacterium]|nr:4'-phosphopantetheinyl transferase superfamily protein [Desulfobacteraceae bacterium]
MADTTSQAELPLIAQALPRDQPYEIAALSLAELEGDQSDRAAFWLTPEEHRLYNRFGSGKRQAEWLGGRMAAKLAVARLLGRPLPAVRQKVAVLARPDGKPLVRTALGTGVELSLSHSGGLAAAIASFFPCGLDVQALTTTVLRVQDRFSDHAERTLLARLLPGQPAVQLTLLWAAKEALRKAISGIPLAAWSELQLTDGSVAGTGQAVLSFTFARRPAAGPFLAAVFLRGGFAWAFTGHLPEKETC